MSQLSSAMWEWLLTVFLCWGQGRGRCLWLRLTRAVVELRWARHCGRHALPAVRGRVDVARTGGAPVPDVHAVIDVLAQRSQHEAFLSVNTHRKPVSQDYAITYTKDDKIQHNHLQSWPLYSCYQSNKTCLITLHYKHTSSKTNLISWQLNVGQ